MIVNGRPSEFQAFAYKLNLIKLIGGIVIEEITTSVKEGKTQSQGRQLASSFVISTIITLNSGTGLAARAHRVHDELSKQSAASMSSQLGIDVQFVGSPTTERSVVFAPGPPPALLPPTVPLEQLRLEQQMIVPSLVAVAVLLSVIALSLIMCCMIRRGWFKREDTPLALTYAANSPLQSPSSFDGSPNPWATQRTQRTQRAQSGRPRRISHEMQQTTTTRTTHWAADADEEAETDGEANDMTPKLVLRSPPTLPRRASSSSSTYSNSAVTNQSPEMKLRTLRTPRPRTRPSCRTPQKNEEDLLHDLFSDVGGRRTPTEERRLERELSKWRSDIDQRTDEGMGPGVSWQQMWLQTPASDGHGPKSSPPSRLNRRGAHPPNLVRQIV